MLQTILLDVDNTLLDFHAGARDCMRAGLAELGLPFRGEMFDTFTTLNNGLWREIEQGTRTREELYRDRWSIIFAALGIAADGPAFEAGFRERLAQSAVPVAGAMELVRYLADKYTLCIASNGPRQQQADRLRRAGMLPYMRHLFVTEQIGHQKPSAAFFDACFAALGQPPRESVMIIGDSLTADIGGGRAYGIRTCWYNHDRLDPPADAADYTVTSLAEIIEIL